MHPTTYFIVAPFALMAPSPSKAVYMLYAFLRRPTFRYLNWNFNCSIPRRKAETKRNS
ncbi:hypothetical protein [Dulcicalothrix desertica]|uniref:hypothetical protein n=1 Tax=Dulcicalothrix desertica TaxID=32056 RepID=UPI001315667F|nr:hypothetical protein [Dulcicalothrix desertica]